MVLCRRVDQLELKLYNASVIFLDVVQELYDFSRNKLQQKVSQNGFWSIEVCFMTY